MKRENPASLAKSLQEVNSEGQYLHVQAKGFRAKNYRREFFTRKNAPVSPSELRQRLGLSKRSDLRRIVQQVKIHCGKVCRISILNQTAISIFHYKVYQATAIFLVPDFFSGDKSSSALNSAYYKSYCFSVIPPLFLAPFFAFVFRSFRPRFGVERFPSFHPCFALFRAFAFVPAMTSDDTL